MKSPPAVFPFRKRSSEPAADGWFGASQGFRHLFFSQRSAFVGQTFAQA